MAWKRLHDRAAIAHLVDSKGYARCGVFNSPSLWREPGHARRCAKCERWQGMEKREPFERENGSYFPKRKVAYPVTLRYMGQTLRHDSREALRDYLLSHRITRSRVVTDADGRKWRVQLEAVLRGAADL